MDDWQVGDLALCIKQGKWRSVEDCDEGLSLRFPRLGCVYRVAGVQRDMKGSWLNFDEFGGGFAATRFIKTTPPEADQFDREVIELMNGKPVTAQDNHSAPSPG